MNFQSNLTKGFAAGVVYAIAKSIQAKQTKMVLPIANVPAPMMSASSQSHRDAEKA
jgi:hypothetical protein